MSEGHAVRQPQALLQLRLGDYVIQTYDDGDWAKVQSAVALLRTVFEDHYVDPEHQSCLFFHGCVLSGSHNRRYDFSSVHRGDRVILSDFTFRSAGPSVVSINLHAYTSEVVRFATRVTSAGKPSSHRPAWQTQHLESEWNALRVLTELAQRFLSTGCKDPAPFNEEYHALHGKLKRPLELQVLDVIAEGAPRQPVTVRSRVCFGPVGAGQSLPMRLNGGDVILVSVDQFTNDGILLTLEGVGSGGVRPGDRLFGLQLFYP